MRSVEPSDANGSHPAQHQFGHPFSSSKKPHLTSVDSHLVAPNDGAHTGTTPAKPRAKKRMRPHDIDELGSWLSERDFAILRSVQEHQFLTVGQIEVLHFANNAPTSGGRIARRALARLRDYHLLGTLKRRVGGVRAGSTGLVHYLDDVGNRLLYGRRVGRVDAPSSRFVSHRLAIADAHVALVDADRRGQLEVATCAVEPASWRRYVGLGGARLTLKTDLYVETASTPGSEYVAPWFLEIDLGTESIPTLLKKCRDYESYRRTGIEQEQGGFPLVVWSMTHSDSSNAERRRTALREAIDRDHTLTPELFCIIAPEELVPLLAAGGRL